MLAWSRLMLGWDRPTVGLGSTKSKSRSNGSVLVPTEVGPGFHHMLTAVGQFGERVD